MEVIYMLIYNLLRHRFISPTILCPKYPTTLKFTSLKILKLPSFQLYVTCVCFLYEFPYTKEQYGRIMLLWFPFLLSEGVLGEVMVDKLVLAWMTDWLWYSGVGNNKPWLILVGLLFDLSVSDFCSMVYKCTRLFQAFQHSHCELVVSPLQVLYVEGKCCTVHRL